MKLTEDQNRAIETIIEFVSNKKSNLLTMGGFGGTGKTTVLAQSIFKLREMKTHKNLNIAFTCFTGKASMVLKDKLIEAGAIRGGDYCGTIHGLIYKPLIEDGIVKEWTRVPFLNFNIIVIDEASMIGDSIFDDLKSYGVPIIAVGDHGQLPPLFSKYNLMENPMVKLEKIHRQAEGNPIIHVSMLARNGEPIPDDTWANVGTTVQKIISKIPIRSEIERIEKPKDWMILSAINRTRIEINRIIRKKVFGLNPELLAGEKVICLKNNRREGIFNGMIGEVIKSKSNFNGDFFRVTIKFDLMDYQWTGDIFKHQFNQEKTLHGYKDYKRQVEYQEMDLQNLFDFGYCLTVHKSQGSEADNVVLIDERMRGMSTENYNRWLYTGVTRCKKNLIIISQK
jgi:exodeoxyribonuclease V